MTAEGRARKQQLDGWIEDLSSSVDGVLGFWWKHELGGTIEDALAAPRPAGDPEGIEGTAADLGKAAHRASAVHGDARAVAKAGLPETWVGQAGNKASKVTSALSHTANNMGDTFKSARKELQRLADAIRAAQREHDDGIGALHSARHLLGPLPSQASDDDAERARKTALSGVHQMRDALTGAEKAGEHTERVLDKLTSEARGGKSDSRQLSAADRFVVANATAYGGKHRDENDILTDVDMARSGAFLDRMAPGDQQKIHTMLQSAQSPEERAYVLKAVACGYNVGQVSAFAKAIHPMGNHRSKLRAYLTPLVNRTSETDFVHAGGRTWLQEGPTCAAFSTVVAHVKADPVYALHITSGGHPGGPDDNPDGVEARLRAEEHRVYDGRDPVARLIGRDGMSMGETESVTESEVGAHTGSDYESRDVEDSADREDVLPEIRRSVDSGKPVPISVQGDEGAHAMEIIGADHGKLQLYNPWGFTTWVDEDDFLRGDVSSATYGMLPEPVTVLMPGQPS